MAEQLIKKTGEGYSNVMPKSWIEAITDKSTGESLTHILQGFNMYFLSYTGNTEQTRCQVPRILRKKGLWITYVKYDGNVYTEWYNSNNIDDKSWGNSSNWRIGNNELVGDLTISANGNWVINGNETEFKAIGEKGNTPLIRIADNKLQVSYDGGDTYNNVSDNPVYTQIRTYNNKLQISTDLGANWTDASDEIAAYFRFNSGQGNNVGNIQISRNNKDWSDLSGNFVNNLHISKYIGADETLPTSGIAEGTIYAKGPTYAESDASHSNPIYRLWAYAYKGNTLAWQDNGEFTSINAGITQELGNSENLVVSQKCVSQEIIQGGVYDVSSHNNDAVFESLQALLSSSNLSTLIPPSVRHGGMSIRFIQGSVPNSYNKYVQYRYMETDTTAATFINTANWQGVDDEPISESDNFVKSGGIASYYGQYEDNDEWVDVLLDGERKILEGRKPDGTKEIFTPVNVKAVNATDINATDINATDINATELSLLSASIKTIISEEDFVEMTLDNEEKIISYRDKKGVLHEISGIESNNIFCKHLHVEKTGLSDLAKDLRKYNFISNDWSDASELRIDEPYCARVNFSGIDNIPQRKGINMQGYMEFWDMKGNYFKKEVIMNAQGQSSMSHPKKNIAVDICNNNGWVDDDTFKIQFGSWVPQDSFHLKAYQMDSFKGLCPVAYKWYDQILKTRGISDDYIWKRALLDLSSITSTSNGAATTTETKDQFDTGARCFPDGFPCIVYLNEEFYGIYSWQLKKHRDNYQMNKSTLTHIHLDGFINDSILFAGNISWTSFEIRNPKGLICMDGSNYDGDNPQELIDSTSVNYDSSNSKHVKSATVKQYIKNTNVMYSNVRQAYSDFQASEKTAEDIAAFKEVYETYFDVNNMIDYIIFSDVSNHYDGFLKNWQWLTYDGIKWFIGAYDCDGVFGGYFDLQDVILPPLTDHINNNWQFSPLYTVYRNELESRYAELRKKKIIDTDNIIGLMREWLNRIGNKSMFDKEWKKWPDYIRNDSIHRMNKWIKESIDNMDILYNYNN